MTKLKKYKIKEIWKVEDLPITGRLYDFDGYCIALETPNKIRNLKILIENIQCCCEDWGYICSEDNFDDFIGATILEVYTTGIAGETTLLEKLKYDSIREYEEQEEQDVMFLTLKTTKGNLQFAVYNFHNGYYGHTALIVLDDKAIEEVDL